MDAAVIRAQAADPANDSLFRTVVDAASSALLLVDRGGRIIFANPATRATLGYAPEELHGQPLDMLLPERVRPGHPELVRGFVQAPEARPMGIGRDLTARHKDGREVPVEVALTPIETEGGPLVLAMVTDITERLRADTEHAMLAAVVESTDAAVIAVIGKTIEGIVMSWNGAAEAMLGWPAAEMIGQPILRIIPEERRHEEDVILHNLREGRPVQFDTQRLHRDGWLVPVRLSISPIRDGRGRIVGATTILHDLTERRRAEADHARLAAIVGSSGDAIISKSLDGTVTTWNAAAEALLGWSAAEMIGQSIRRIIPPDRIEEEPRILTDLRAGQNIRHFDTERLRRDGSLVAVCLTISPIRDKQGKVIGVSKIMHDIGERLRAEEARAHLATIVESSGIAILSTALDGTVTSWNGAAERLLGWSAAEMIGASLARIIPEDRQQEVMSILDGVDRGEGIEDLSTMRRHRDGSLVPVSITVSPIRNAQGQVVARSAILRDMTEQLRAEQALRKANETLEQRVAERTRELAQELEARHSAEKALVQARKMEAVGQLTGGIAHDFNNLLTVISGNLHFITEMGEHDERLRRLAGSIQRAVDRGARLISQLLAFSRRQPLLPQVLRLDALIRDFSALVQRAVGETVQCAFESDDRGWACEIDPSQFEAAVLNLVFNARDAMPRGGRITIATRNAVLPGGDDFPAGRYVAVSVSDTGRGMPPEVLERATEPFFTTKDVGKGSGLGLSQVYGFVQQSGGVLRIESRVGDGTRVTMLFPQSDAPVFVEEADNFAPATAKPRKTQVLVVEDDLELLDLVQATLTNAGLQVFGAHDGREALAFLDDHPGVNLMLSDVVMPNGTSGVELGHEAQRRWPDLRVVLMSGYPRDELGRFGSTAMFPFLSKPFRPGELVDRLDKMLHAER